MINLCIYFFLSFLTLVSGKNLLNIMHWALWSDSAFNKGNISYDCILELSTKILSIVEK